MNWLHRLRYSPFFVQLVVIRRCNLSCSYCNEYDHSSSPIDLDLLKSRAEKIKALGTFAINLTGGEPSLHPQLPELIRFCRRDLKFLKTSIITNGYKLKAELIEALNEAGLQDMQISIDGVKPNRDTVKVLDALRPSLELLQQKAKFNVVVSGVIGACPPEETLEVIRDAKARGFRPRLLVIHDGGGQVKLDAEALRVFQEVQALIPRSFPELSRYQPRLIETGIAPFKCRGGSRYLYVDEAGLVSWCSQTRKFFHKDLNAYGPEDLKREFYREKSCQDRCTLGCVRASSAADFWRPQQNLG